MKTINFALLVVAAGPAYASLSDQLGEGLPLFAILLIGVAGLMVSRRKQRH